VNELAREAKFAGLGLLELRRIAFTVVGIAQPKGSMKTFIPKGWNRAIVTDGNPRVKDWQQTIVDAAGDANPDRELLHHEVELRVHFYLARPKSLPKRTTAHLKKPDLDKLVRAVKDALTGTIWRDDSQVTRLHATKAYAAEHESPYVTIEVEGL
jgi:crossover junction endodeoxyribonuclease RusA